MYGVPKDLDLAPFLGTTLDYIGIGKYQLSFVFSADPRTTADCVVDGGGYWEIRDSQSLILDKAVNHDERDAFHVHHLLGRTVANATLNPPQSFMFVFDNGMALTFVDDSDQYETWHVRAGKDEVHI